MIYPNPFDDYEGWLSQFDAFEREKPHNKINMNAPIARIKREETKRNENNKNKSQDL